MTAKGLEKLAVLIVRGGKPGKYGWPLVNHIDYGPFHLSLVNRLSA